VDEFVSLRSNPLGLLALVVIGLGLSIVADQVTAAHWLHEVRPAAAWDPTGNLVRDDPR